MFVNEQEGMIKGLIFLFTWKSLDLGYSHLVLENIDLICSIPRSWVVIWHCTYLMQVIIIVSLLMIMSVSHVLFFFLFKMRTTSAQSPILVFILPNLSQPHVFQLPTLQWEASEMQAGPEPPEPPWTMRWWAPCPFIHLLRSFSTH